MKIAKVMALTAIAVCAMFGPSRVMADPLGGNFVLNVSGYLRVAMTKGGSVSCGATAILLPDTSGNPSLSALSAALLANSNLTSTSKAATLAADRQNFTCQVIVPYLFNNVPGGQQVGIYYQVVGSDPGYFDPSISGCVNPLQPGCYSPGTNPGKTRQLLKIQSVPANGETTILPTVQAYL